MQISTANDGSTVQITNGQARVILSADGNWTGAATGNWLSIGGSTNVPYDIANVYPPGTPGNTTLDRWELTIVGVINQATNATASYAIGIDFLAATGLWDPQKGDTQTLQFLKRNFRILDALAGRIGASFQSTTVAAAGNTNSTQSKVIHSWKITANAGSGAYTATFCLLRLGRSAGDRTNVRIDVAANANPKVQIFDDTTGGTKLFEYQSDGTATAIAATFVYDGAAWYLENADFIQ